MPTMPHFVSLEANVLDYSRVTLNLETTDFSPSTNVTLNFDFPNSPSNDTSQPQEDKANLLDDSPYPNIELSLLDKDNKLIAQATIIEHRDKAVSLTLHIRRPEPGNLYTAKADMLHRQQIIHSISTPFTLKLPQEDIE